MLDQPTTAEAPAPALKTSLKLTEEQERKLTNWVATRLKGVCKEMGRDSDGRTEKGSWLDIRRLNQLSYEGDYSWRESVNGDYLGGVFDDSNFSRGDGKRYVRHMAAKITDDLLGTSPFFAAMKADPDSNVSTDLIKAVENEIQVSVEDSAIPENLREAVELALARNETVVKIRNVYEASGYRGPATVLVDEAGQPVITPAKQLYVFERDNLLPVEPMPEEQAEGAVAMVALEKDSSFRLPAEAVATMQFQEFDDLPQTLIRKKGLEGRVLDPRDFICPLKVDSIHDADICAHFYDALPVQLGVYGATVKNAGYQGQESGANSPIRSQGEDTTTSLEITYTPTAETYARFDADGDGVEEELFIIFDRKAEKIIFSDYLANHMPRRPFEVLHGLRKVPGRWYGVGIFSDKWDQLVFIDKTFNRINLKNGKSASLTAIRRDAIEEWKSDTGPVRFGGDEVVTFATKWKTEDGPPVEQFRLIEVSDEEMELMNNMIQASDQEFGFISAADASANGMNQSKTATGISNLERSSNNIVKATERVHEIGITAVLRQCTDLALEAMDENVISLEPKKKELLTLNRDEIRALPKDVKLLLTRSRSTESLAVNQQAVQIANLYFDTLAADPRRAKALRPMYIAQLKALEVNDADDLLPEVTDEMIAQWAQSQKPPEEPPKESISIKYVDLLRSEQEQALIKLGIQPGQPPPQPIQMTQPAPAPTVVPAENEVAA